MCAQKRAPTEKQKRTKGPPAIGKEWCVRQGPHEGRPGHEQGGQGHGTTVWTTQPGETEEKAEAAKAACGGRGVGQQHVVAAARRAGNGQDRQERR